MKQKIIEGLRLDYEQALDLVNTTPKEELYALANGLREHFHQNRISTCMIMNAKSGACTEDCKWCSQSKFYETEVSVHRLVDVDAVHAHARIAHDNGVHNFALVTSGKRLKPREVDQLAEMVVQVKADKPRMEYCSSLGLLPKEELQKLWDAGVRRYHCNLETAPSYFPEVCTTHTTEEKIATIKAAQEVGMKICSGGIIGMGETMAQRIELAVTLQKLHVDSIPVNLLMPIAGTPMAKMTLLSDEEILTTFAMFCITNPTAEIRFAAGRARIKNILAKALQCGVSASMVGDMLTTANTKVIDDFALFEQMGYDYATRH